MATTLETYSTSKYGSSAKVSNIAATATTRPAPAPPPTVAPPVATQNCNRPLFLVAHAELTITARGTLVSLRLTTTAATVAANDLAVHTFVRRVATTTNVNPVRMLVITLVVLAILIVNASAVVPLDALNTFSLGDAIEHIAATLRASPRQALIVIVAIFIKVLPPCACSLAALLKNRREKTTLIAEARLAVRVGSAILVISELAAAFNTCAAETFVRLANFILSAGGQVPRVRVARTARLTGLLQLDALPCAKRSCPQVVL